MIVKDSYGGKYMNHKSPKKPPYMWIGLSIAGLVLIIELIVILLIAQ